MFSSKSFRRWLYPDKGPNWLGKIINRFVAYAISSGVQFTDLVTLEAPGRKSGKARSLPLVMITVDGERYLVSMFGYDVQWVHNVRANSMRAVLKTGEEEEIELQEVPVSERASLLKIYLQHATGARPHVSVDKNDPIEKFEALAPELPVFRIIFRAK